MKNLRQGIAGGFGGQTEVELRVSLKLRGRQTISPASWSAYYLQPTAASARGADGGRVLHRTAPRDRDAMWELLSRLSLKGGRGCLPGKRAGVFLRLDPLPDPPLFKGRGNISHLSI